MSNRRIIVLAALALASLTFASQAEAGQNQTQPSAAQSYWQNLKRELTSPATSVPVQRNQPAAVTSVRG